MEYLWMVAGAIIGWVGIEFMVAAISRECPTLFNIGMAFVGALTAYTIAL